MTYDAVIVGYGPVGATTAALLGKAGLRVVVVEQETGIYDKPRAITFDHEIMRVFQACGLSEHMRERTGPHPGTHYIGVDGTVIKIFDPLPPPHPLGWMPTGTFVQPQLEAALRARVNEFATVDVRVGHQLTDFTERDGHVEAQVRDLATNEPRSLRGRYLLACDGANSFARKRLAIPYEDLAFDEWWMVVDVLLLKPVDLPVKCRQYCWPERPATYIVGPGSLRRWEIKLLPGEDPDEFGKRDNVVRQLARFVNPAAIEVWRSAVYRFHAVLAERWQSGRVLLLGDAVHQTPPFLGQGMCAGIRDAANLAWKLAMVLQEQADQSLLASYEVERKPHVRTLVSLAKQFGEIIGELDPEAARERDATLRGQLERGEAETVRQRFIPGLIGGVLGEGPAVGTLFVQPRIDDDRLLDDALHDRFLIATVSEETQGWLSPASLELWRRIGGERAVISRTPSEDEGAHDILRVTETDGLFESWMNTHGCAAVIVRPDRYVYGTANDAEQLNGQVHRLAQQIEGACRWT
jgi:3-(3-hydroxy-phenyl)propionate hydroxylase